MKIIAFFNRDGGTFRTTDMQAYAQTATDVFTKAGHDIECHVVAGADIERAMQNAAESGDFDAMVAGGGDGTISTAAAIAWKSGLTLGVVPAGTMNLFARSLKLPLDIHAVLDVLAKGKVEGVDIGSANGRAFVHQFSAGLHARMVRYRNAMDYGSRLGKMRASARAAISVILNPPVFEVEFSTGDGFEHRKVSAISVSNNEFGRDPLLVPDGLTGGHLGFYVAHPLKPSGVARLVADILRGRLKESASVTAMKAQKIELHFPKARHDVRCVIDGELLPMDRDVELLVHAGELKVLVP